MRWLWALAVASLVLACSRFGSSEDGPLTTDAGPDASSSTASSSGGAVDGGQDLGPNLLPSGDFEGATGGECPQWVSYNSTSTVVSGGKVNSNACHFCGQSGHDYFTMNSPRLSKPVAGEVYEAHAWFKPDGTTALTVELDLRAWNADGPPEQDSEVVKVTPTSEDWIELHATLTIKGPVPDDFKVDAYVGVAGYPDKEMPPCGFTDGIELFRVNK